MSIPGEVKKELKNLECNGIILSVTEKQPCFSTISVKQTIDTLDLPVCTCSGTSDFWSFVAIGDKIEKEKGEFALRIIKQSTNENRELEYPYCFR